MPANDLKATVDTIAQQLGETERFPLVQIRTIVKRLGPDTALAFLQEALEIEAQGGMLTTDGSRRRTPGGVFFYLVRSRVSKEDRRAIWPYLTKHQRQRKKAKKKPRPTLQWDDRLRLIGPSLQSKGEASSVKVTLIGRPGRLVEAGNCVITTMQSSKVPALPKGLPTPPDTPTTYVVYIAQKHWQNVAESIKDPEDALIVQGFAAFDPEVKGLAVFAMNATTKRLQESRRQKRADDPSG